MLTKGKTLQDFTTLKEYKIKDGDKVNYIREFMSELRIRSCNVFSPWILIRNVFAPCSGSAICFFSLNHLSAMCFFPRILIRNFFLWILIRKVFFFYQDLDLQCFSLWIMLRNVFYSVIWIRNIFGSLDQHQARFLSVKMLKLESHIFCIRSFDLFLFSSDISCC